MRRGDFLAGATATRAAPYAASAQGAKVLHFIPQQNLNSRDPMWIQPMPAAGTSGSTRSPGVLPGFATFWNVRKA